MSKLIKINSHHVHVAEDVEALIAQLTLHIFTMVETCLQAQHHYFLSLSGGSTPKKLYDSLAADARFDKDIWQCFEIYFGDERYVPQTSAESNFRMAKDIWLDHVPIPPQQIHPVPTHCAQIEQCVEQYMGQLATIPKQHGIPRFDLILLGMGDDGHTASLFPGTPALDENEKWLASVYVSKLKSWRITFTYPLINHAREIIVLVTGASKAAMLKRVLTEPEANLPIQGIQNAAGIRWYVDAAAAAELV